jgi:ABC-type uncharacterized transport system substrate-binding protein
MFINKDTMKNFSTKKIILFLILSGISTALFAHPHVFITSSVDFILQKDKLQGAWLTWDFDRYFSSDIIKWLDTNKDGVFSEKESQQVYNNAFINLRHYYYYTFIRQGNQRTNPARVEHFQATQKDGIMTYRFYIDLSGYTGNELYLAVYDYTYYCDVGYTKPDPVKFDCDTDTVHPEYEIVENKKYPVYYDPCGPATDTSVHYKWKPGLNTYYPREIHITW